MVTPVCSKCKRAIPAEDVNVASDIAFCRPCNLSHRLSELTLGLALDASADVNNPPAGAWFRNDGTEVVIGATHRSLGGALGLLFFALFWNGIVSVFVVLVVASTLRHLGISVPGWFPAPNMHDNSMSVGMTVFLWLFLTPFIAIGLAMIAAFLSCIGGRTEIRIQNENATVFSGIGSIGRRRRFEVSQVKTVRIDDHHWRDSDGDRRRKTNIVIETHAGKLIKFGSMLSAERRKFVASAARARLTRS